VANEFLSDDWIDAAKAIYEKYASQMTVKPPSIKMNLVITETPSGEERRIYTDTSSGTTVMDKGELPDADVTLTLPFDVAKKQMVDQDQAAAMQAFMSGKVKVQGDMMKLMGMQGAAADPMTAKINEEIKGMTS